MTAFSPYSICFDCVVFHCVLVKKDMDLNEHERLSSVTQIQVKEQHLYCCSANSIHIGALSLRQHITHSQVPAHRSIFD